MTKSTYTNPILAGFHPDPSIIRVGDSYFLATSSFEYFPGIPIYHSTDLIKWTHIGHALTRRSQLDVRTPEPGGGVWAPTLRYHDGWFYVTACCFDRYRPQLDERVWPRGFYVKTRDIWDSSSWSDPVWFDQVGFDQDLFWDPLNNDQCYLSTTRRMHPRTRVAAGQPLLKDFAIHTVPIDLDTGTSLAAPQLLRSSPSGVAEGSHLLFHAPYYYLLTAEGGTESGHCEYVSRSKDGPLGPWERQPTPLWRTGTGVDDQVQNTGHLDIVEGPDGHWWGVCLGVRPKWGKLAASDPATEGWRRSVFGRETFLVPMIWVDGWPVVNGGRALKLEGWGEGRPGLYVKADEVYWKDDFEAGRRDLALGWYRKNTPVTKDWSLTERPGYLRIHGLPYNLSTPACPSALFRKQTHQPVVWRTRVSFHPTVENVEAGTVIYWNYTSYASIGICKAEGSRHACTVRLRNPDGTLVEQQLASVKTDVVLLVRCGEQDYRFGYLEVNKGTVALEEKELAEGHSIIWLGEVDTQELTKDPPIGAPFTGMMLGLYAFGESEPCLEPADFHYAEFKALEA